MPQETSPVTKELKVKTSVDLIFPLQTEITIEISKIPSYISQLTKLFDFYNKQMTATGKAIKNYNIASELGGLSSFLIHLDTAIKTANLSQPIIVTDPEKISVADYEFITMRILATPPPTIDAAQPATPTEPVTGLSTYYDARKFSDSSTRQVLIYNKIDYLYLTNKTYYRSLAVLSTIETGLFGISPSTLSLLFNIDKIINEQINSPIPAELLLCRGKETALSKFGDGFSIFGFDVKVLSSKVLLEDFLNAYIHPIQEIVVAPRPPMAKGCTKEARDRISLLRSSMNLHDIQIALAGFNVTVDATSQKKYEADKKEFIQLTRLCPDTTSEIALFEGIKNLEKLGKLFTDFLERFNIACIVDEAIKCVMPQIPCDQILRDLTVENFEQRLQTAFPHQKKIIEAISLTVKQKIDDENIRLAAAGQPQLDPAGQTKAVLDGINMFVDLEALCKIDIEAIIALIKALFNFKFPAFNIFDWQFNFKIDFDALMLQLILDALLSMINQILNELVGCDALDGLIAGIINSDVEAPTGLYGDIAAMFGGDFDFSNTSGILKDNVDNFLTQSTGYVEKIIKFETKLSNGLLGSISTSGTLGLNILNPALVGSASTNVDAFGGIVRASSYTTGSAGMEGFLVSPPKAEIIFDVTKLADNEKQKDFLKEIGQFSVTIDNQDTSLRRISDDSIVNILSSSSAPGAYPAAVSPETTSALLAQTEPNDIYSKLKIRNKNRHILSALVALNEIEGTASMLIPQKSLSQEIKDYVKTCFSLLSPSEVIDLITANASQEVKLTIDGVSRIRFPILHSILKYPDRHAILFASFGKLTGLDSIGPRLQILSSNPAVKQMMVDPNFCLPFASVYDFRKGLMNQTLPSDLANKLMDDLIEDDRNRANNLVNSLAKKIAPADLMTSPDALAINKTPDGKQIQEIDEIIDNTLSNIFDQIKISFDEEIEAFPKATASPYKTIEKVYEIIKPPPSPPVFGFKPTEANEITNEEFIKIQNTGGSVAIEDAETKKYYPKIVYKDKSGLLASKAFENYKFKMLDNNTRLLQIEADGNLSNAIDTTFFTSEDPVFLSTVKHTKPNWNFKYTEHKDTYSLQVRTSGEIMSTSSPIKYAEKIIISGSLTENNAIKQEIKDFGISEQQISSSLTPREYVFEKLLHDPLTRIGAYDLNGRDTINSTNLALSESHKIYKKLVQSTLELQLKSKLLIEVTGSTEPGSLESVFLNLIDFSPLPTQAEKAACIDVHLLQTRDVIKRTKKQIDTTTPENIVNTNSRINTRYSDGKPGHISEKLMTGLADTFIRTSVIHNIFKGLFIFDQFLYTIDNFGLPDSIYSFFENRIRLDIKNFDLVDDFTLQIDKIYKLYKEDEKSLIPQEDDGSNKLRSLIIYHIQSILEIIKNNVSSYAAKQVKPPKKIINTSTSDQTVGAAAIEARSALLDDEDAPPDAKNTLPSDISRRESLFNSIISIMPYSNFWSRESFDVETTPLQQSTPRRGPNETQQEYEERLAAILRTTETVVTTRARAHATISPFSIETVTSNTELTSGIRGFGQLNSYELRQQYDQAVIDYQTALAEHRQRSSALSVMRAAKTRYDNSIAADIEIQKSISRLSIPENINFIFEYYVRLDFNTQTYQVRYIPAVYKQFQESLASTQANGIVNLQNFKEIMKLIVSRIRQSDTSHPTRRTHLYSKDTQYDERSFWLNSVPKFGIRLSVLKNIPNADFNSQITAGFYNGLQITNFNIFNQNSNNTGRYSSFNKNVFNKAGMIQNYIANPSDISQQYPQTRTLQPIFISQILPLISEEIELPIDMYDFDNTVIDGNTNLYQDDSVINDKLQQLKVIVDQKMKNNSQFDLLANYCLPSNLAATFGLFNNMTGMANEATYKLLDGTKQKIKDNYIIQKNSSFFKDKKNKSQYEKQKEETSQGPSAADMLKAAASIPINILKGLATTVDPNIFLADKIVLAGKMGFVQPKFKRVAAGDVVLIENSTDTHTITQEESGVVYDGYYNQLSDGRLQMKANPTSQGLPINDMTIVAETKVNEDTEKTVIKLGTNGKAVTKFGAGQTGVPWNIADDKPIDPNTDVEDVQAFDQRPSTVIYPGENINIPYSVASLLLAPFPIFPPGASLTSYNILMPFGPLFLALEPLIYETLQFKASIPKNTVAPNPAVNDCVDNEQE